MHCVDGSDLLKSHFSHVPIRPGFAFEGVANRNALDYLDKYSLGPIEEMETMFRGTLRYQVCGTLSGKRMNSTVPMGAADQGFSRLLDLMRRLGLLDVMQLPQP